jgi:hypothetical protein
MKLLFTLLLCVLAFADMVDPDAFDPDQVAIKCASTKVGHPPTPHTLP